MTSTSDSTSTWDRSAIRAGASVALVFAVPFSIAARLVSGSDLAVVFVLLATLGFLLGASVSAWHQNKGTPLSHAMVTATGSYCIPQAVFILVKLVRHSEVHWSGVVLNLLVTTSVGAIGGLLGSSLQTRGVHPRGRTPR